MVIAGEGEDAAIRRGTGIVGVLKNVYGAIAARTLAVPTAEYAVFVAIPKQVDLLCAPQRRRC